MTQAVQTAFAGIVTPTPVPSETPLPTATLPPRTPPALPPIFTTGILHPLDTPHTYVAETCQYLQDKWNPNNAAPGTVVMVVMFHSITQDPTAGTNQVTAVDQSRLMNDLHEQGFQAITMQQMADFMEHNAYIPQRSVLLIVDDRHFAEYFNAHFRPFYEQWGWPVVNAYIAKDERPDLWAENAALAAEGWVDYQAHGVIHNIPMDDNSTDEYLTSELQGGISNIQKFYNKTPNPRGPIMYNWVPLGDQADPGRPYYIPEGPVGDPLMTLPRYWDIDARAHLDEVRRMGQEAAAYAEGNKAVELEYYDIVCSPTYGPIPGQ
jgi:hypothetical protein